MRYFLVTFTLLSLVNASVNASEANRVLLTRETWGGNPPPHMAGWSSELVIMENGQAVARQRENYDSPWEEHNLAMIDSQLMTKIKATVAGLTQGTIVFEEAPECFDFPSTSYTAVVSGQTIMFAARSRCQNGYLKDFTDAWRLKDVLDGLTNFTIFLEE